MPILAVEIYFWTIFGLFQKKHGFSERVTVLKQSLHPVEPRQAARKAFFGIPQSPPQVKKSNTLFKLYGLYLVAVGTSRALYGGLRGGVSGESRGSLQQKKLTAALILRRRAFGILVVDSER